MLKPELPAPRLEFIFAAHVTVGEARDLGDIDKGRRRVVPITGGTFSGPEVRGTVLPGGADWQIIRGDGVAELEARYTLQSEDGALIEVCNLARRHGPPEVMALAAGLRVDPTSYYFRGATFFETSAQRYTWLTRHIVVCTGHREPSVVKVEFYRTD
jgi:Protein of unknown function (DUF3237)